MNVVYYADHEGTQGGVHRCVFSQGDLRLGAVGHHLYLDVLFLIGVEQVIQCQVLALLVEGDNYHTDKQVQKEQTQQQNQHDIQKDVGSSVVAQWF